MPSSQQANGRAKRIALLGSTGSIGVSTLSVVDAHPDAFDVVALAANTSVDAVERQARQFRPEIVAMRDVDAAAELKSRLTSEAIEVVGGLDGVIAAATWPGVDLMLSGIVGGAGILPTLEALRQGIDIAFVNKEVLVLAGELVMAAAKESGARILPVDSEISAVFQCLQDAHGVRDLRTIYLTASGGPLRETPAEAFPAITPEEALNHPNWDMGPKVTIDSATLLNKGLEVIEARWLFDVDIERIRVVVHPQSIVHSYVEFVDGSVIAQLGVPDMRTPIQYALTYPARLPTPTDRLDLVEAASLTFEEPDMERFPCLGYAFDAAAAGGTMPAVLSGADEVAVAAFLAREIRFDEIPLLVHATMQQHELCARPSLTEILDADAWARKAARAFVDSKAIPAPRPT
ncbi:1-deoxy-D-xylulose-5-phosphate reductoisomerase [Candidatus Poribacteria bacterium]|nr:1-deoxy-D-xylulose-5-phosphate reductoisomerase [Candidatus Poribacteria bacterium]MBT5536822.1 1-deoxy-D-xylulose-5-phosphate reductoisomerase [Candidatus Poribacteria bacterium]MBT5710928.1 1-deoxy-D-xylulose-5-phosphate reductoisomerase [Candidatus Poribacteria bacterium]MBT7100628.1 1-deoxy-D-xylulose-5-phosphate reductoisomerase [Candidatus Poribacteria bacterium]MBT7808506.1 1-deoxy-D-xylulose-5-phosphate reductoisomerase [Candidatus Poribacteria bacterium]